MYDQDYAENVDLEESKEEIKIDTNVYNDD